MGRGVPAADNQDAGVPGFRGVGDDGRGFAGLDRHGGLYIQVFTQIDRSEAWRVSSMPNPDQ